MSFALIMDQENTKLSKLDSCGWIQWLTGVLYLWIYEWNIRREFRRGMSCFSCMTSHISPCNLMLSPFWLYLVFAIVERCTLNASNHSLPDSYNTTLMLILLRSNYAWVVILRVVKSSIIRHWTLEICTPVSEWWCEALPMKGINREVKWSIRGCYVIAWLK